MLRPACRHSVDELLVAAHRSDRELDLALLRVGVLAPADLEPIRSALRLDAVALQAAVNADGHCAIEVFRAGDLVAYLRHNGELEAATANIAA